MNSLEVLYNHNLKRTSCREGIIEVIMASDKALNETEIREQLPGNYDRTTFYRSFKTLLKHKIIHKIVLDNQLVKYAMDNSITHKKQHAHFYCNTCHTLQCLDFFPLQEMKLPAGYIQEETEVIIKGTCAICTQ